MAEFGILGPLEVRVGGRPLVIGPPAQQALLAALLVRTDRPVTMDQLIDTLWDQSPPATAATMVQIYAGRLRKALGDSGTTIRTERSGYRLVTSPGEVDAERFRAEADRGIATLAAGDLNAGDLATGVRALRTALREWRGPALAGFTQEPLRVEAARLEEARLNVLERCAAAELALGRAGDVVGELDELTVAHPFREHVWSLLMAGLYACGRQADALVRFQRAREVLDDELALEPGDELRRTQRDILAGTPPEEVVGAVTGHPVGACRADAAAVPEPRPAELPPPVTPFTGRAAELDRLRRLFAAPEGAGELRIGAINGGGGVGKSALAVRAAYEIAALFPDGQLYADLRGATPGVPALRPVDVIGRFLRALGTPAGQVPDQLDEASARFRSAIAERRVLILLDNARDAGQVRPILPGAPGCGVLVTSRRMLAGLDGAEHVHLEALSQAEAVDLLARMAGAERVGAEADEVADVARWCAYLPLAIRIAGAKLAARPRWPVRVLAVRLASTRQRLDELADADRGARSSFAVSYEELRLGRDRIHRAAAAAFVWLGVWNGPEIEVPVAARLMDQDETETERALEALVDARLLETTAPGCYRMHDLLRQYARELAGRQHSDDVRARALARALPATAGHGPLLTREAIRPAPPSVTQALTGGSPQ